MSDDTFAKVYQDLLNRNRAETERQSKMAESAKRNNDPRAASYHAEQLAMLDTWARHWTELIRRSGGDAQEG